MKHDIAKFLTNFDQDQHQTFQTPSGFSQLCFHYIAVQGYIMIAIVILQS